MIVDTSAMMAILLEESGYEQIVGVIRSEPSFMSAATYVELLIVATRRLPPFGKRDALRLLTALKVTVVPLTPTQAALAATAYREFGESSGSEARLNLGDTYSYATAIDYDQPLVFVGEDFAHTDVRQALSSS